MVIADNGLPDPDHPSEDLRVTDDNVIVMSDDDSDLETDTATLDHLQYRQYQPLPTCPNEEQDTVSDDDDTDTETNTHPSIPTNTASSTVPVLPITPMESSLLKEIWSGPSPKVCDIEMDSNKVDEVKQVMLNVTLPASAIPDWANNIPEDEWKHQLMKRLENMGEQGKSGVDGDCYV